MNDTGEAQGAEPYDSNDGPSIDDRINAFASYLPPTLDGHDRSAAEVLSAALAELQRLREYAAIPQATDAPEDLPGWREIAYEEPPYGKVVLLRRGGETPYVGYNVKPDPEDRGDDGHGLLFSVDDNLWDGEPFDSWSEIPDFAYDDVIAISATLDGENTDDDTSEDAQDDAQVFYRDIDDPPPADTPVLFLMLGANGEPLEPFVGWITEAGFYFTEDPDGERVEVDEPDYWSYLPKPPAI